MTNEEQVNIIIGRAKKMLPMMKSRLGDSVDGYADFFRKSLLNMAEWKDKQFKEYLEKKRAEMEAKHESYNSAIIKLSNAGGILTISEIINGLL